MLLNSEFHNSLIRRLEMESGLIWASNIIENKIWLGAGRDAKNLIKLNENKITHILNCTNDIENYYENINNLNENNIITNSSTSFSSSITLPSTSSTSISENIISDNQNELTSTLTTSSDATPSSSATTTTSTPSSPFTYLKLDVSDFGSDPGIGRVFNIAAEFVQKCISTENGRVLIHCANGTNRSVTITIAVLMILNGK